jgi:hypothetical protein
VLVEQVPLAVMALLELRDPIQSLEQLPLLAVGSVVVALVLLDRVVLVAVLDSVLVVRAHPDKVLLAAMMLHSAVLVVVAVLELLVKMELLLRVAMVVLA